MIYLLFPAYNEEQSLPELLDSLAQWARERREDCHVIAVNDGSCDSTAQILGRFDALPLTVVEHAANRGVAEAFRSGFRAWADLSTKPHDLLVTLEADNTSSLSILDAMVAHARGGFDLVLGSCYAPGGEVVGTNLLRSTLSLCANTILRCTPGMPRVRTFSSFYRVHRPQLVRQALRSYGDRLIEEDGFVCVVEMLLKFGLLGARICEVPLRLDGSKRKGVSKMKVVRTIRGYLELFLHSLAGRLARPTAEQISDRFAPEEEVPMGR